MSVATAGMGLPISTVTTDIKNFHHYAKLRLWSFAVAGFTLRGYCIKTINCLVKHGIAVL